VQGGLEVSGHGFNYAEKRDLFDGLCPGVLGTAIFWALFSRLSLAAAGG
jgi:hypothetical protein